MPAAIEIGWALSSSWVLIAYTGGRMMAMFEARASQGVAESCENNGLRLARKLSRLNSQITELSAPLLNIWCPRTLADPRNVVPRAPKNVACQLEDTLRLVECGKSKGKRKARTQNDGGGKNEKKSDRPSGLACGGLAESALIEGGGPLVEREMIIEEYANRAGTTVGRRDDDGKRRRKNIGQACGLFTRHGVQPVEALQKLNCDAGKRTKASTRRHVEFEVQPRSKERGGRKERKKGGSPIRGVRTGAELSLPWEAPGGGENKQVHTDTRHLLNIRGITCASNQTRSKPIMVHQVQTQYNRFLAEDPEFVKCGSEDIRGLTNVAE
ncbi:hypothetical protein B0H14DRAFT_2654410 [Mycena olivaceomarginata]|nr:hypothetical protein B0H14DRAFT_2654410 [Mycena olivaceomarginata]